MRLVLPIILIGLSTPALALDKCSPSEADKQIRVCTYVPLQRYAVNGLIGFPVNLEFGADERIKRIEPGYTGLDAQGNPVFTWRGPDRKPGERIDVDRFKNNVPIWPFAEGPSAMTVVTALQDGTERPYLLNLKARRATAVCTDDTDSGCPSDPTVTAGLSFVYPAQVAAAKVLESTEKKHASAVAIQVKQAKAKEDEAVARLKVDPLYGQLNKNYGAKAEPKYQYLAPANTNNALAGGAPVWDNGWQTVMVWPGNAKVPAISMCYTLSCESKDEQIAPVGPSNLAQQTGQIRVISAIAPLFRLRIGDKAVMDIINKSWSPNRPDPGTGTPSPDVLRQVIQAKKQ